MRIIGLLAACCLNLGCTSPRSAANPEQRAVIYKVTRTGDSVMVTPFYFIGNDTGMPMLNFRPDQPGWYYAGEKVKPGRVFAGVPTDELEGTYVRISEPRKLNGKLTFDIPDVGSVEVAPRP